MSSKGSVCTTSGDSTTISSTGCSTFRVLIATGECPEIETLSSDAHLRLCQEGLQLSGTNTFLEDFFFFGGMLSIPIHVAVVLFTVLALALHTYLSSIAYAVSNAIFSISASV